jgi:hypothetical protein
MTSPALEKLVLASRMAGEDAEETALLREMLMEAAKFIRTFRWCGAVKESYFGLGVGKVVAVFLFKITPERNADEYVWVVVGDLPPAYVSIDHARTAAGALDAYIGAMQQWVDAVTEGRSVKELIPVNVSPTKEYAEMLRSRLKFLRKEILSQYEDDLRDDHGCRS